MRRISPLLLVLACALAALKLAACGAGLAAGDDDVSNPDASANNGDAGVNDGGISEDAAPVCFQITLEKVIGGALDPAANETAPTWLIARAVDAQFGAEGITWRITRDDDEVLDYTRRNPPSNTEIDFRPVLHGNYKIVADAGAASDCPLATYEFTVDPSPAETVQFRLRYLPRPGQALLVATQDDSSPVPISMTGPSVLTHDVTFRSAYAMTSMLIDKATGLALGAQLTFTPHIARDPLFPTAEGRSVTLFTRRDDLGNQVFSGQIANVAQDIVVAPYDAQAAEIAIAPFQLLLLPEDLRSGQLRLDVGQRLEGDVVAVDPADPGGPGTPVAQAVVLVSRGGLLPALVRTSASGHFEVYAPPGHVRLEVWPPAGSDRSPLVAPEPLGVTAGGGKLTVQLAVASRTPVSGTVKDSHGVALAHAHVTFVSASAGAGGTITQAGVSLQGNPLPGETRVFAETDSAGDIIHTNAAGEIVPLTLPVGAYKVIVEPPASATDQALSVADQVLSAGSPAQLALATVKVHQFRLKVVGGAYVTAVARGQSGVGQGSTIFGKADDVTGELPVKSPPLMVYDVIVDPPRSLHMARMRFRVDAAAVAEGEVKTLVMPASVEIRGKLMLPDGSSPAAGMRVTAHCEGGGCADPEFVFADTEAGPDGSYVLYLPNFTQLGVP